MVDDSETPPEIMRAFGDEKPVVVGEYNGPWLNLYPEATSAMNGTLAQAFAAAESAANGGGSRDETAPGRTPEQAAMAELYERMADLPPQLQMFMAGCPRELEDLRNRI